MSEEKSTALTPLKRFNKAITNTSMKDYITDVVGGRNVNSFVTNMISLVSSNVALQNCEPMTIIYAGLKATALKLSLDSNLGEAYVIPFKNTKENITVATFQIGAKGFYQLAIRSGLIEDIIWTQVYEGELISKNRFTNEYVFDETKRVSDTVIGFYAKIVLKDAPTKHLYMTTEEMKAHGKRYSKTFDNPYGLWQKDFVMMGCKTIMKLAVGKFAPKSIDIQQAIKFDQAMIDKDNAIYIDNEPELTDNGQEFSKGIEQVFGFADNPTNAEEATFEEVATTQEEVKEKPTTKK